MVYGPVTGVQRLGSQRRAALVLAEVLRDAVVRGLPCLHWCIGDSDLLSAQCLDVHAEVRRATFVAWAGFLHVSDWAARDHDGLTTMTAFTTVRGVRLTVTANLFPEPGTPGYRVRPGDRS